MNKSLFVLAMATLASGLHAEQSQEYGRVLSAKPVIHQLQAPQQVCSNTPVAVSQPQSGAGAALGAVAGGVIGSTIAHGAANVAATGAGMIAGAVIGDSIEGQNTTIHNVSTCYVQWVTQNLTVYEVEYEYAGKRYKTDLPNDPGKTIALNIAPAQTAPTETYQVAPGTALVPATVSPQVMAPAVYVAPYPNYSYPYYVNPYGYYPPFTVNLGIGYHRGFRR